MKISRFVLIVVLAAISGPGAALAGSVRVPSTRGSVFAVYHRLHRAGLRVAVPHGQTFTNLGTPQVNRSRPAAGQSVRTGSVVALSLAVKQPPSGPVWRGRTHRLRLQTLVGARASSIPPLPGVALRLHLTKLDLGTGPGLLFNYAVTREQPAGGSTVEIRHGQPEPRVDFWAQQIPGPAYPCAPAAAAPGPGAQIVAADAEAIVTQDSSGQLFGCLRAVGHPFPLHVYDAAVTLAGHWVELTTTSTDGKYMTCSEQVLTVDLSTQQPMPVYGDGCMAGEPGLPVAIDDLAVTSDGSAVWRTRSITGEARALTGISCPSAQLCVAVDGRGDAVTSTDPPGGRSGWSALAVEPDAPLLGISCPTTALCVAIDQQGHALTTTDPEDGALAHWSLIRTGLADLGSVACSSAHLCLVASSDGAVATTPDPASGVWTVTQLGTGLGSLPAAACPTDTRCYVTDGSAVETSGDPQGGAGTWSSVAIDAGQRLSAISCPSASDCVAGDGSGALLSSTAPTTAGWTRTVPARPVVPTRGDPGITAVSCPDTGHCAAVDAQGEALTSSDPVGGAGGGWATTQIDSTGAFGLNAQLSGIACAGGQCVATDSFGQTLTAGDSFGAGVWTIALADASPDCTLAPCVVEKLWAHDSQGGRVLDAPAPAGGDTIAGVALTGNELNWTDAGSSRQATLG